MITDAPTFAGIKIPTRMPTFPAISTQVPTASPSTPMPTPVAPTDVPTGIITKEPSQAPTAAVVPEAGNGFRRECLPGLVEKSEAENFCALIEAHVCSASELISNAGLVLSSDASVAKGTDLACIDARYQSRDESGLIQGKIGIWTSTACSGDRAGVIHADIRDARLPANQISALNPEDDICSNTSEAKHMALCCRNIGVKPAGFTGATFGAVDAVASGGWASSAASNRLLAEVMPLGNSRLRGSL